MKRCKTCGFKPCRCEDLAAGYMGASCLGSCWPQRSDALAVHPRQARKAAERNKRHGINVTYDPHNGVAIIPDRNERRKLLRLEGMHDNNGGYGD